nr:hypothetical protein [Deltaproteobacteria bacterium]
MKNGAHRSIGSEIPKNKTYLKPGLGLLLFGLIWAWNSSSLAGIITIETQTSVSVHANKIDVKVTAKNNGIESAFGIQAQLTLFDETLLSRVQSRIEPETSQTFTFEKPRPDLTKGRYPLTIRVVFHDANQYPFSAVSGLTFPMGEDTISDLQVQSEDITLDRKRDLAIGLKNLGSDSKMVRARLFLPRELIADKPEAHFRLNGQSAKKIRWVLRNFSALNGAVYPVAGYFEYDSNGKHYTSMARLLIRIVQKENFFSPPP